MIVVGLDKNTYETGTDSGGNQDIDTSYSGQHIQILVLIW